jgi:DNA polymerase-3 subunit epsilon/ATP-dependent DNA helicase DinG
MYSQQERILPGTRTLPSWTEVEIHWDDAGKALTPLLGYLQSLFQSLASLGEEPPEEIEDLQNSLGDLYRRFLELQTNVNDLICKPQADRVYWVEANANGNRLNLQAAPLHIGPLVEKILWNEKSSVVLTSATLTTNGEFDYLRSRLNASDAGELAVDSPFDYENSALLYMANDIPEPADMEGHQRAVEKALLNLAIATGGRMLALFTNYDKLKRCGQRIGPALADKGITLYEQGEGASASTLLEIFRESDKAVLLGTRSFWEGVDITGEALSVLAIVKLPFDVPSEPIIAARSETFDDPFNEYNLPEAILRFRQGFGRLIRSQTDRGVVAILDRRILTKRYGRSFIESLPHCKTIVGPVGELPMKAAAWLKKPGR